MGSQGVRHDLATEQQQEKKKKAAYIIDRETEFRDYLDTGNKNLSSLII